MKTKLFTKEEAEAIKKKMKKEKETISASSMGQLQRKKVESDQRSRPIYTISSLREAKVLDETKREIEVIILREGKGNKRDKHFYTKDAINSAPVAFEGAQCYADHPSRSEETDRPERSIRDLVGHYERVRATDDNGTGILVGILKINDGDAYQWAWELAKESVNYAQKYPDKDLVGISINADGKSHKEELDGEQWNFVTAIAEAVSADIVTRPAAGGKFLKMMEQKADQKAKEKTKEVKRMEACKACEKMKAAIGDVAKQVEGLKKASEAGDGEDDYKKGLAELSDKIAGLLKSDEDESENESEDESEDEAFPAKKDDAKDGEEEDESEDESEGKKKAAESNRDDKARIALLETKVSLMEKGSMVEKLLEKSKLPHIATKKLRPFLMECSTPEKMSKLISGWKESLKESIVDSKPEAGGVKEDYSKVDDIYEQILKESKK